MRIIARRDALCLATCENLSSPPPRNVSATVAIARAFASAPGLAFSAALPILREGLMGVLVVTLQNKLKAAGIDPGAADGSFVPKTVAAVKAFQGARGLSAPPASYSAVPSLQLTA